MGEEDNLVAFDGYWGKSAEGQKLPYVERVNWKVRPEASARVFSFQEKEMDAIYSIPSEYIARLQSTPVKVPEGSADLL